MILSPEEIDLFDRYTSNLMTEQEEESTSLKLIADPKFNDKYQNYLKIKQGIRINKLKNVLEDLQDLEKNVVSKGDLSENLSLIDETKNTSMIEAGVKYATLNEKLNVIKDAERTPKRPRFRTPVLTAAAILILIGAFFWLNQNELDPVVQQYFQPYESIGGVRSAEPANILHEAYRLYDQRKYRKAINKFKTSIVAEPTETKKFFLANAHMAIGNTEMAAEILMSLLADNLEDPRFWWYLSLCYIDLESNDKAIPILQDLIDEKTDYSNQAAELLQKIND